MASIPSEIKPEASVDEASVKCRATILFFYSFFFSPVSFSLPKKKYSSGFSGLVISIETNGSPSPSSFFFFSFLLLFYFLVAFRFFYPCPFQRATHHGHKNIAEGISGCLIMIGYDHVQIVLAGIVPCFPLRRGNFCRRRSLNKKFARANPL